MAYEEQLTELKNLLPTVKNILIALPVNADIDKMAAGLALHLSLAKIGKEASIVSETTIRVAQSHLFAIDRIQNTLPQVGHGGDLTIKLEGVAAADGTIPSLEKLDWYAENNNLNLVFHVVPGQTFQPTNIVPITSGSGFDLIFVIGAASLSDLGNLQIQNQADLTIIVGDKTRLDNSDSSLSATVLSENEVKKPLLDLLCSKEDSHTRLLGIILSKFEYIDRLDVAVVVLRQQDFHDMRVDSKHIPLLVPELKESFGDNLSYLFLIDSLPGAQGILWSPSNELRTKFRDIAGGQQKGSWVLLRPAPLSSEQLKYAFLF